MNCENKALVPSKELFGAVAEMLDKGLDADFTVTGSSMWPFLAHGRDRVIVRKASPKVGDVVLYCPVEGQYLLHRINKIKDGRFRAAGDGNTFHDGCFDLDCVVGTAVGFCRKGKMLKADRISVRLFAWSWNALFFARKPLLWCCRRIIDLKKRRKNDC